MFSDLSVARAFLAGALLAALLFLFFQRCGRATTSKNPTHLRLDPVYLQILDSQFDQQNSPRKVHRDLFNESTPWLHGRGLGDGKTVLA